MTVTIHPILASLRWDAERMPAFGSDPLEVWRRNGDWIYNGWIQPLDGCLWLIVYGTQWDRGRRGKPLDDDMGFVGKRPLDASEVEALRTRLATGPVVVTSRLHRVQEALGV